jgi:Arylsulfotransferase (ASST)
VTAALSSFLVPASAMLLPPATAHAATSHAVTVSAGTGSLTQWPSYAAGVDRFALVPSSDLNDSVVVTAGTSDPHGTVLVDGKPVPSGKPATVSGLSPGDEVSVIIDDASGHSAQSWIYLPSTFPTLSTTGTLDEGNKHVFLTLSNFLTTTPYETVVDQHAVPTWFEQSNGSDLKPVDLGATRYSLARHADGGGYRIDELDRRFRTIRSHQLDGIPAATDFHDSELLPDGRTLLLGYTGASRDGHSYLDAVIQIVGTDGAADFTWNSKDHVDPAEAFVDGGTGDYAHINALQYLPASGDILASFRNLSQVMLIAGPDDSHHTTGDVIWRLGGQENEFTFLDDPDGGNCAQHMARLLPNGHLMLFDNGSRSDPTGPLGPQSGNMCPDPANPGGPAIARPQTRITEYKLNTSDPNNLRARLVWEYVPTNRYAAFAGSQQRLADGRTFVGWSQANHADGTPGHAPVASLVSQSGEKERWRLFGGSWFSYRSFIGPAPDADRPEVAITSPIDGTTFGKGDKVRLRFRCTDTGGSGLDTCRGSVANGHRLDTSSTGRHTVTVTAKDGAGNRRRETVTYRVTK